MSNSDPIADMLSALSNASKTGKEEVVVAYSGFKEELASLLKREGFVSDSRRFKEKGGKRLFLAIKIAFGKEGEARAIRVKRISKPGRRVYATASQLKRPSLGIRIISTSRGVMTDREARKRRAGGEVIAEVW